MKKITKDKDDVNPVALCNACEKANVALPILFAILLLPIWLLTKTLIGICIYPIFSYKSEHIVTPLIQSHNL